MLKLDLFAQDLEDLTQHLDALMADTPPDSFTSAQPAGEVASNSAVAQPSDPFDTLASATRPVSNMPYATYGQLVTPQNPQLQAQQVANVGQDASSDLHGSLNSNSSQPSPADSSGLNIRQQPIRVENSPCDTLDSMGSTPSPRIPEPTAKDAPLIITVCEPQRKEATGVLGMKGNLSVDCYRLCATLMLTQ